MMENGARCITLVSRTGTAKEGLQDVVNEARSRGALVTIKKCDVSNETEVQKLVAELVRELPPIRGVIHAAMVLRVRFASPASYVGLTHMDLIPRLTIQGYAV
jgi:NAD(P)-dependent dehydrogenase (short-subunit alcohol dehydrogenase family)